MILRQVLLAAARSPAARRAVVTAPPSRALVERFIAGERREDVLRVIDELIVHGLHVSVDHLGEDTAEPAQADAVRDEYRALLARLGEDGTGSRAEVSVKLSALGSGLGGGGLRAALERARAVCEAAAAAGTTVTLDMEGHDATDDTLSAAAELRADFPRTGVVLQSCLRRTEADCRELLHAGSRVRLVKGAYAEPAEVAFQDKAEVDRSYVRCLRLLMEGHGYPMVATHDPRLIAIAGALAVRAGRPQESYEFQMLYGIRSEEQRRLAAAGETVRVYVPYGDDWYGYFMRRLAERPANLAFFLRSLGRR